MCNCDEKKPCCGCLMGGCECVCECSCHTGDRNDPCWAFPRLDCEECNAKEDAAIQAMDEQMEKERKNIPTDHDIAMALKGRDILDIF